MKQGQRIYRKILCSCFDGFPNFFLFFEILQWKDWYCIWRSFWWNCYLFLSQALFRNQGFLYCLYKTNFGLSPASLIGTRLLGHPVMGYFCPQKMSKSEREATKKKVKKINNKCELWGGGVSKFWCVNLKKVLIFQKKTCCN